MGDFERGQRFGQAICEAYEGDISRLFTELGGVVAHDSTFPHTLYTEHGFVVNVPDRTGETREQCAALARYIVRYVLRCPMWSRPQTIEGLASALQA